MLDIKLRNIKIDYKCLVDRRDVFRELSTHELLLNSKRNSCSSSALLSLESLALIGRWEGGFQLVLIAESRFFLFLLLVNSESRLYAFTIDIYIYIYMYDFSLTR